MDVDFTSSASRANSIEATAAADSGKGYRSSLALLRTSRAQTLHMVDGLSQSQMDFRSAPGKWSVGEVLDHLILGERLNLSYIAEVIGMQKAGRRPILNLSFRDVDISIGYIPKAVLPAFEFPFRVMNMMLPGGVRDFVTRCRFIPAQNPNITNPRRGRPANELRHELMSSFRETERLIETHRDLDYSKMKIMHPLLGNNDVAGLLRFVALHEQRHQAQIKEILNSPGFPSSPTTSSTGGDE